MYKIKEYEIRNFEHNFNTEQMSKIKEIIEYHKEMDEDIIEYKNKVNNQWD